MLLAAVSLFSNCSKTEVTKDSLRPNHNNLASAGDGLYDLLGYGYDVTGEYLALESASSGAVINVAAFKQAYPTRINMPTTTSGDDHFYYGADAYKYIRDINEKRSYNASVQFGTATPTKKEESNFTANAAKKNTNIDKYTFSSKYSWATYESVVKIKKLQFTSDVTLALLMNYLTPDFISNINTYSAAQLVQMYGTHVLLDISLGGRLTFDFSASVADQTTEQTRERSVEGGLGFFIKKFGFNLSTNISSTEMNYLFSQSSGRQFGLHFVGGTNNGKSVSFDSNGNTSETVVISGWQQSINATNCALVDIERMVPLDQFISDPVKKAQVSTAIQNYIASRQINIVIDPSDGSIPIYHHHKYSDGTGHYLSTNSSESGFIYDRLAFRAFPGPKPGAQPVFEFWGQKNGKIYHYYQFGTSQTAFWHLTGVKFYAYPSQVQGTISVYGYSNPWGEDHYFTDENLTGSYWVTKWGAFNAFPLN